MTDDPTHGPEQEDGLGAKLRIQKYMAACGVASRRQAEELLLQGRVRINGRVVTTLGTSVEPGVDRVELDGRLVAPITERTILFNKPRNCLCSKRDPVNRPLIYEYLPPELQNLNYVGRLDFDTSGLLLLTSNGELLRRLTLPQYKIKRVYLAWVEGHVVARSLKQLEQGIQHEGELLQAHRALVRQSSPTRTLVEVVLTEGRNREVKRLFEAIGHQVLSLDRIRFAELALGNLPPARWRPADSDEMRHLAKLTGLPDPTNPQP